MKSPWRIAIGILAVLVLAGTAVGIVAAQTDGEVPMPGKERLSNFISGLAENLGISQEELEEAIDQTQLDLVDDRVTAGDLTEEQADEIRERIESGEGPGFFGKGFRQHGGGFLGGEALAEFLGVSSEELRQARADEQSLAQIAEANGVSRDDLIAFLVGQVEEQLAAKVEEGKIDQAQADEKLAQFEERVDDLVDSTQSFRPGGGHHRPRMPFHEETAPEPDGTIF